MRRRKAGTLSEHIKHVSPAEAWAAFNLHVEAQDETVLEPEWLDALTPHRVRCAEGHVIPVRPGNIQSGQGICEMCAGQVHDVFYIVTGPRGLKFGISSRDGSVRLDQHRRDGYGDPTVRLWAQLPGRLPDDTEDLVLARLKAAGHKPNWRREYFNIWLLDVVLGIVDQELKCFEVSTCTPARASQPST